MLIDYMYQDLLKLFADIDGINYYSRTLNNPEFYLQKAAYHML